MTDATTSANSQGGILGWVERTGNKLPDPVFIFFYLIIALVVISVIASLLGVAALHPTALDEQTGGALLIEAVTLRDVNRVARRLLAPGRLTTVVVGEPEGLAEGG